MIFVKNLTKYFGSHCVLKDISFEIKKGEIVGFLGLNGAGKTTMMRILTSYLLPTSGIVRIADFDVVNQSLLTRSKIGYLPETPPLYPEMSVRDYLSFAGELKSVKGRDLKTQIDKVLEECALQKVQHQSISTLSKGFRQRVGIAQAIIHDPEILILDEPTSGLDPQQILQVRNLIKALEPTRTVILSTHILSEIEQMAKRVMILHKKTIVANDSLEHLLKNPYGQTPLSLEAVFLALTND